MSYIGKDVIHYGCGLELDPEKAIAKVARSARKNIRKASRAGFEITRRAGTADELARLRELWYLPEDPNFPNVLSAGEILYLAELDGELAGGMILLPVGSHLFLNNLTASAAGKKHQLQSLLLWHAVNDLRDSQYRYIDVGVSYRPNLYRFFTHWATFKYPVIFHPPAIAPRVSFAPFLEPITLGELDEENVRRFCHGAAYTLLPDVSYARSIADDKGLDARQVPAPRRDGGVQIVDLTRLLPIQYGALLLGREIPPAELWDRYGCYDFVKTAYLERVLSRDDLALDRVLAARRAVHASYVERFGGEDLEIQEPDEGYGAFAFKTPNAVAIAERYRRFEVEVEQASDVVRLPSHQNLAPPVVEYVYAIYRGYLNLCSEWMPTGVKGSLKTDDPAAPGGRSV